MNIIIATKLKKHSEITFHLKKIDEIFIEIQQQIFLLVHNNNWH